MTTSRGEGTKISNPQAVRPCRPSQIRLAESILEHSGSSHLVSLSMKQRRHRALVAPASGRAAPRRGSRSRDELALGWQLWPRRVQTPQRCPASCRCARVRSTARHICASIRPETKAFPSGRRHAAAVFCSSDSIPQAAIELLRGRPRKRTGRRPRPLADQPGSVAKHQSGVSQYATCRFLFCAELHTLAATRHRSGAGPSHRNGHAAGFDQG